MRIDSLRLEKIKKKRKRRIFRISIDFVILRRFPIKLILKN
ncbi:hypothetical protein EV03_1320 [Prochlorococcus marinus str. PAC1]|uniref:Uncharacterized protein n=1 Tax=Prochlorococcus marinus str. PAC1 TaxID=59924 RepID=A0A0A2C206_PROMR|nr:hypothetical protein EV03_1320 [Prochlorococcus marinus str. PAC1]